MDGCSDIQIRRMRRYSQVSIGLRIKVREEWKRIRVNDWNEIGFNFYFDEHLKDEEVLFSKGPVQFPGRIVWCRHTDNDEAVLEALLNTRLIRHMRNFAQNKTRTRSVLSLIRAQGRSAEKRRLLALLGDGITDEEAQRLVADYRLEHALYRYGVSIDSMEWADVVSRVAHIASVVDVLDDALRALPTPIVS